MLISTIWGFKLSVGLSDCIEKKSFEKEPTNRALSIIKWYTHGSRTDKGSGASVFGPGTSFSETSSDGTLSPQGASCETRLEEVEKCRFCVEEEEIPENLISECGH